MSLVRIVNASRLGCIGYEAEDFYARILTEIEWQSGAPLVPSSASAFPVPKGRGNYRRAKLARNA